MPENFEDRENDVQPTGQEIIGSVESVDKPEKLGIIPETRLAIGKAVDNKWYERVQKAASYGSVFLEPAYRGYCGLTNTPEDETVIDILRYGFDPIFAINLGAKLSTRGISHLKTSEAWIDMLTLAASFVDILPTDNTRLARIIKTMKGGSASVKFMRAASIAAGKQELEDKSVDEIREGFTWFMMYTLASTSLVADWKNIDYSNPIGAVSEIGFSAGLIVASKLFLEGSVRKTINKNYTRTLQGSRNRINDMIDNNPELEFLRSQFEDFDENASSKIQNELGVSDKKFKKLLALMQKANKSSVDPHLVWDKWAAKNGVTAKYEDYADRIDRIDKNEILVIIEGMIETMVDMKELINPVGEDMALDSKGVIKTKELDAVVMVTDLRNFTSLSSSKFIRGNILGFLKLCYFRYLRSIIKKHGGKILNHTGDGLVIYFTDQKDKTKYDASVACAQEINEMTNMMNEIWKEEGVSDKDENHETGVGMSSGTIRIGDVLTLSKEVQDDDARDSSVSDIHKVKDAFESKVDESESEWASVIKRDLNAVGENKRGGISRLVGLGEPINLAARLESVSKAFLEHTGLIRESHYKQLDPSLQSKYIKLEEVELKGVDDIEVIYGLPRYGAITA